MTEDDVASFVFFPHGAEQVGSIPARTTRVPKNQPPGPDTGFRPGFFLAPGPWAANREPREARRGVRRPRPERPDSH